MDDVKFHGNVTMKLPLPSSNPKRRFKVRVSKEMGKVSGSFEGWMEVIVSPAQREVFLIIDEWWKRFGYSPSIRDIAYMRGRAVGPTHRVVERLVDLGAIKKIDGKGRTVRPTYINFRHLE
jgi:hypothetical protein